MTEEQNRLASLREIVDQQLELVTLSLYVATQGPTSFRGESLECHLGELKLLSPIFLVSSKHSMC